MDASTTHAAVAELVKAFSNAAPDGAVAQFQELAAAVWSGGEATDLALPAVPTLVAQLDLVDDDRKGYLVVLLGLLAETEYPATGGPLETAVRAGLDSYLALLGRAALPAPLQEALLYLVAHFPADRERVLAATADLPLDDQHRTRLARGLIELDRERPDLGRVWPAPSIWRRDDEEDEYDQASIAGLSQEQILTNWHNDTRTLHGYTGALAYAAVRAGAAVVDVTDENPPERAVPENAELDPAVQLSRHASIYRCTGCGGAVAPSGERFRCASCDAVFAVANGVLDLSQGIRDDVDDDATANLLQKLSEMPGMGVYYERVLRPSYLRIAGSNWHGAVTPADEDEYIATHIRPVDGPVLDLAAGAGRWTTIVAETIGADRLVALDMGLPMLSVLRDRLPDVPAIQGSALDLPFQDASFGAINMWNALQAFPDDAEDAIAEVGRCLRPGGTFTILTFVFADDPVARYFQESHYFPSRPAGHLLFELDELRRWFSAAGLEIRDETRAETFVILTAERS
jgi:SAM-dependent methyltransferase